MAGIAVEMGKDLRCDVQAMNVIQIAPRECHRAMGECHQCYLEGISLNVGLYRDRRISAVVQVTMGILLQEISEKEIYFGKHCQLISN